MFAAMMGSHVRRPIGRLPKMDHAAVETSEEV